MEKTTQQRNKEIVLEAFDTLFNKRDYAKAETFWSPKYIQHSAHIEPGREGLFNLVKSVPATLKYEPGLIVAESDASETFDTPGFALLDERDYGETRLRFLTPA